MQKANIAVQSLDAERLPPFYVNDSALKSPIFGDEARLFGPFQITERLSTIELSDIYIYALFFRSATPPSPSKSALKHSNAPPTLPLYSHEPRCISTTTKTFAPLF
jgi:hypothetical protein